MVFHWRKIILPPFFLSRKVFKTDEFSAITIASAGLAIACEGPAITFT